MQKNVLKYISIALLVILLLTCFLGWTSAKKTMSKLERLSDYLYFDVSDFDPENLLDLIESNSYLLDSIPQSKTRTITSSIKTLYRSVKDYALAPVEIAPSVGAFKQIVFLELDSMDESEARAATLVMTAIQVISWALFALFAGSIVLNIVLMLTRSKGISFLPLIPTILYFLLTVGMTIFVNYAIEDYLNGFMKIKFLRLTPWPFVALACAIGSMVLSIISGKPAAPQIGVPAGYQPQVNNWAGNNGYQPAPPANRNGNHGYQPAVPANQNGNNGYQPAAPANWENNGYQPATIVPPIPPVPPVYPVSPMKPRFQIQLDAIGPKVIRCLFEVEAGQPRQVGRGDQPNVVVLNSSDMTMSRIHCSMKIQGGRLYVRNLSPNNKTFLNGIDLGSRETGVDQGDVLRMGSNEYRVSWSAL